MTHIQQRNRRKALSKHFNRYWRARALGRLPKLVQDFYRIPKRDPDMDKALGLLISDLNNTYYGYEYMGKSLPYTDFIIWVCMLEGNMQRLCKYVYTYKS